MKNRPREFWCFELAMTVNVGGFGLLVCLAIVLFG